MDENMKRVKDILIRYYNEYNKQFEIGTLVESIGLSIAIELIEKIYFDIFGEYIE